MKTNTKLFFLFFSLLFIDQIVKYFSGNPICNQNIAWNIPVSTGIFYFTWIIIISVLTLFFLRTKKTTQRFFLIMIFAGAISNMIDRIRLGCVVDYIDLKTWPVFNLADVYITVGIFLFLINFVIIKNLSSRA